MDVLKKIAKSLNEGGYLIVGKDEFIPLAYPTLFIQICSKEKIYQKFGSTRL
jgi:chemotaxis methyl-accepting protein methylase